MKTTPWLAAEPHRISDPRLPPHPYGSDYGAFQIPGPCGMSLRVIVSAGGVAEEMGQDFAWDHVSVSCKNRCPNWQEMEFVKRIFFKDDEWAMQLHAPPAKHINVHPYCLHIWRPHKLEIPIPPPIMVG